jgi:hypothetical protein
MFISFKVLIENYSSFNLLQYKLFVACLPMWDVKTSNIAKLTIIITIEL